MRVSAYKRPLTTPYLSTNYNWTSIQTIAEKIISKDRNVVLWLQYTWGKILNEPFINVDKLNPSKLESVYMVDIIFRLIAMDALLNDFLLLSDKEMKENYFITGNKEVLSNLQLLDRAIYDEHHRKILIGFLKNIGYPVHCLKEIRNACIKEIAVKRYYISKMIYNHFNNNTLKILFYFSGCYLVDYCTESNNFTITNAAKIEKLKEIIFGNDYSRQRLFLPAYLWIKGGMKNQHLPIK